jgi:histidinol-phosphate aminotransferase
MAISRRTLLRRLGAGAAAAVTAPRIRVDAQGATHDGAPRDASQAGEPIRLNRNENPYGPSDMVMAAMRDTTAAVAGRYPDADALRRKVAAFHRVPSEQVVLGCGSSEILRIAIDTFVGAHGKLVAAVPMFELIGGWAERAGATVVGVPVTRDYSHDLNGMLARIDADTRLVYICNPHNPTGRVTRRQDLEAFLRKLPATMIVLMDEAYHDYVGEAPSYASFIDRPFDAGDRRVAEGRPVDDSRVIVTRSFSKIHGLAGLRVGYAIAPARIARVLASHTLSNGVTAVAARAAAAALDDTAHVRTSLSRNTDDRQEFLNQATARMLRQGSVTNFVMLDTGRDAIEVVEHFRKHGILVSGPVPGFGHNIRVSLGTAAQMREFWRVWDLMIGHKMSM